MFEIFNPEKVKKFVNPLFCLYIGYFSLASVGVRSAATQHNTTNLIYTTAFSGKINKSKQRTVVGLRLSVALFELNRAI